MRPCKHGYEKSFDPQCPLCRLWRGDPAYRAAWADGGSHDMNRVIDFKTGKLRTDAVIEISSAGAKTLECIHLGEELDTNKNEPACCRTHACDVYGKCRRTDKKHKDLPTCDKCEYYRDVPLAATTCSAETVTRLDIKKLAKAKAHFNCSICRWQDKLLLAYRTEWGDSRIHIAELNEAYQPVASHALDLWHPFSGGGCDDPRLFVFKDQLHLAFTGVYAHHHGVGAAPLLTALRDDLTPVTIKHLQYQENLRSIEKNWTYFEHAGELLCVYNIKPHTILRVDDETVSKIHETETTLPWFGGLLRGGSCPVLHNGEYYCFFHGVNEHNGRRLYSIGCYTFAAAPPFAITRLTSTPILIAPDKDKPRSLNHISVAFPCGAIRGDGQWIVSYGVHDTYCNVATFADAKLDRALLLQ